MKAKCVISMVICVVLLVNNIGHSQNLLSNGDFSNSTDSITSFISDPPANIWSSFQESDVKAKATMLNGICNFEIISSGNNTYSVQLVQGGISLKSGHSYKLSFDVKADSDRSFGVYLGENGGNWMSFISPNKRNQNATVKWSNQSIEFDVYTIFPYHKLSFELGTVNTSIFFDNIELIDLGAIKQGMGVELSSPNKYKDNPGFLVESELNQAFINSYKASKFIIFPTITRTVDNTNWSELLSATFAQKLKRDENLDVSLNKDVLDPGELIGKGQFEFFKNDMKSLANELRLKKVASDYYIIPEILFAPKSNETLFAFGIHIFILNKEGENVYSFLLNSHHELFIDAKLYAFNPNESELEELQQRCLDVGLKAFRLLVVD